MDEKHANNQTHPAFEVHILNDGGKLKALAIAAAFQNLVISVERHAPRGRNHSIFLTKCEEACFFAKKAMAEQKENQE